MLFFGKPGTLRVRGVQRAQLRTIKRLIDAQIRFNTKEAARVPPVAYLTGLQLTAFQNMSLAAGQLLAQVNQ